MSKSGGGQRQSQNTTTSVDSQTQEYLRKMWEAAQAAGNAGPSPLVTGATDYNSGAMKAGNMGLGALSGDPAMAQQFMNPYQKNVIDELNKNWGVMNAHTMNGVNDAATRAGAFGGSRHGVATGTALAENARTQSGQVAGLLNTGFDSAMNRAAQSAAMGFQGAGNNANLGMGGVGNPQQWMLQMMNSAFKGPMGSTTSGTSTGTGGSVNNWDLGSFISGLGGLLGKSKTPTTYPTMSGGQTFSGAYG